MGSASSSGLPENSGLKYDQLSGGWPGCTCICAGCTGSCSCCTGEASGCYGGADDTAGTTGVGALETVVVQVVLLPWLLIYVHWLSTCNIYYNMLRKILFSFINLSS